jgi:HD-GYP domain-containing protein (c-di-GMP phosphodiesterase class II)
MAVADTYDAITSDRPYRNGENHTFAVKEITRCSGTQFDPEIVNTFLKLLEKNEF